MARLVSLFPRNRRPLDQFRKAQSDEDQGGDSQIYDDLSLGAPSQDGLFWCGGVVIHLDGLAGRKLRRPALRKQPERGQRLKAETDAVALIADAIDLGGRKLICIEQRGSTPYGRHGVDLANTLVAAVRERLWSTVGSSPPYRRYYLYLCPFAERPSLMPQLASIYALTFYLGSVTRYRPNVFRQLLDGTYGPRISEFVAGQAAQFVYLMASEFVRRDVTRPSIV